MNILQIMLDYLKQYPPTEQLLKVNSIENSAGEISLNTIADEQIVEQYVNGDKIKAVTFAVVMTKVYDNNGYTDTNNSEMYNSQKFIDWLKEQSRNNNLPAIPGIISIEPLQSMPNLAGTKNNTAKYMFMCQVEYFETK